MECPGRRQWTRSPECGGGLPMVVLVMSSVGLRRSCLGLRHSGIAGIDGLLANLTQQIHRPVRTPTRCEVDGYLILLIRHGRHITSCAPRQIRMWTQVVASSEVAGSEPDEWLDARRGFQPTSTARCPTGRRPSR